MKTHFRSDHLGIVCTHDKAHSCMPWLWSHRHVWHDLVSNRLWRASIDWSSNWINSFSSLLLFRRFFSFMWCSVDTFFSRYFFLSLYDFLLKFCFFLALFCYYCCVSVCMCCLSAIVQITCVLFVRSFDRSGLRPCWYRIEDWWQRRQRVTVLLWTRVCSPPMDVVQGTGPAILGECKPMVLVASCILILIVFCWLVADGRMCVINCIFSEPQSKERSKNSASAHEYTRRIQDNTIKMPWYHMACVSAHR